MTLIERILKSSASELDKTNPRDPKPLYVVRLFAEEKKEILDALELLAQKRQAEQKARDEIKINPTGG